MGTGTININYNIQTANTTSSSVNTENTNQSTSNSFKDVIKNETEKNSSKTDKTTENSNTTEKEDLKDDVIVEEGKEGQLINQFINIAQNQIIYNDFIMNKNVETPITEQAVSSEINIFPIKQETSLLNTNTNLSNIQISDANTNIAVDKSVVAAENTSNQGNIILNLQNNISSQDTKDLKTENISILQNNNIVEKTSDNSNTLENISENKNILNYNDIKTEKNVVLEKSSDNNDDLMQENDEFLFSGFEGELQTVQKTFEGDIIQVKVSDSNLINSDTVVNELADKIIMRSNNEFDLQLEPEELGKIHINVTFENGETKVSILCSTQQAMDALSGNTDKLAALLENRTGNTTFVQIRNEENQFNENYQQQEGRNQERNSDEQRRDRRSNKENSIDFLEQMRLGLM